MDSWRWKKVPFWEDVWIDDEGPLIHKALTVVPERAKLLDIWWKGILHRAREIMQSASVGSGVGVTKRSRVEKRGNLPLRIGLN